jgi:hypothetical protein
VSGSNSSTLTNNFSINSSNGQIAKTESGTLSSASWNILITATARDNANNVVGIGTFQISLSRQ